MLTAPSMPSISFKRFAQIAGAPRRRAARPAAPRLLGGLVLTLTLSAMFAFANQAAAQTVTLPASGIERLNADGTAAANRNGILFNVINYDDCINDRAYKIPATVMGYTQNYDLDVWAGAGVDCAPDAARGALGNNSGQQCWHVLDAPVPRSGTVGVSVNIRVQDILSSFRTKTTYERATNAVCANAPQGTVSLYFVFTESAGKLKSASEPPAAFTVATRGPAAPTAVEAGTASEALVVGWTAATGQTGAQAYKVYCDDGSVAADDASTSVVAPLLPEIPDASIEADAATASADAGSNDAATTTGEPVATATGDAAAASSSAKCPSSVLIKGQTPPASLKPCGSGDGAAVASATITTLANGKKLQNGKTYAVAVSAVDVNGNPGPLSEVVCGTPEVTDDFFTLYKEAGGGAGGCSTGQPTMVPVGLLVLLGSLVARRFQRKLGS
jgi:hypothetical protein